MTRLGVGLGTLLAALTVLAEPASTPAGAFNAGKAFATTGKTAAGNSVDAATAAAQLPHYGTTAAETHHFQGGRNLIGGIGTRKQNDCRTARAASAFDQQECDAVNYLSRHATNRTQFTIDKTTDPLMVDSKDLIRSPGAVPGTSSQQCRVEQVRTPGTFLTESCTESMTIATVQCRRILTLACDPQTDGCDQGGIVPGSWSGDMAVSYTPDGAGNYILQFGTIADNYWTGSGTAYDRTLRFTVRDVSLITRFILTQAAYDDWLLVKVNDAVVYVGPRGGDRLDVIPVCRPRRGGQVCYVQVQFGASCLSDPELNTSWNVSLNIDLRPYLRDGENILFMRTVVAGAGEGAIQIATRQACPRSCTERWDTSECAPLEARSRP